MLMIIRENGQAISIGNDITIRVVKIENEKVTFEIDGTKEITVQSK